MTDRLTDSGKSISNLEIARNVDTDATLGLDPWRPMHEACDRLCLQKPKADGEMRQLAELWGGRSDIELRLLGNAAQDLDFLSYFPGLRRLNVQTPIIKNIDGLRHVADSLTEFTLANTRVRISLGPIADCKGLKSLHLQRQKTDFAKLSSLAGLNYLGLSGVSLHDLSALLPFEQLQSMFMGFCKPLDLGLLGHFAKLEALHLLKINNLRDLSALNLNRNLRRIELEWLPHVETLPDLVGLHQLEELEIATMKSLRDISSIARAPALRFLALWDCRSLAPESFKCLVGHPTLKKLNFGIGRPSQNDKVAAMFPAEMTQTVNYKITRDTYMRRPTS
jgi:Leucine-rich repeat (LRR) protein